MTTNQTHEAEQPAGGEALWDEMSEAEYRVIGPPGCGKTTWLGKQVELALNDEQGIMIVSLTKSAAAEISGRDLPISHDDLGTPPQHLLPQPPEPDNRREQGEPGGLERKASRHGPEHHVQELQRRPG